VGERLRITLEAARVNAGMLQKDVCQRLGVSVPTLVSWEAGKTLPPVDKALELSLLYGVKLDDLIFCRKV
jgi:transcriptional regulator with XRE-family HTH domain